MAVEWKIVKDSRSGKPIGAVGFIGNKIAVITAFYDDKDADKDGEVKWYERVFSFGPMGGRAVAEVANHAYADPAILVRDPTLYNLRGTLTTQFAAGLLVEGIYRVYFARGISKLAGAAAAGITANTIKQFVIRKGMEKAVKEAYRGAMTP